MAELKIPFLDALLPEVSAQMSCVADLEQQLEGLCASARQAWPALEVEDVNFLRFVAERLDESTNSATRLAKVHGADLYLVCGILQGSEAAIAILEARHLREVHVVLTQNRVSTVEAEETIQELRESLIVGLNGALPGLSKYGGRGKLQSWLRTTAVRAALRRRKSSEKEVPLFESILLDRQAMEDDPETLLLKRTYRAEFKAAFRLALGELPARDRALLKMRFMDDLSVQQIAKTLGVHRVSTSRLLSAAKQRLFESTEAKFHDHLNLSYGDFRSVMDLIQSRLEMTFRDLVTDD